MIEPADNEHYWIRSTGYDPENPVMVARFKASFSGRNLGRWDVMGGWFNHDKDVEIISRIQRPRNRRLP